MFLLGSFLLCNPFAFDSFLQLSTGILGFVLHVFVQVVIVDIILIMPFVMKNPPPPLPHTQRKKKP